MTEHPKGRFVRISVALAAFVLLCAFSYPLVQEGYEKMGATAYKKAERGLLESSVKAFLTAKPDISWDTGTSTLTILNDLAEGVDRDFDGVKESFLPASANPETLAHAYRIVYKSPESFKVVIR